jgi:hypothetical protein
MPRISAAAHSVVAPEIKPQRLKPPPTLSKPERELFTRIVATNKPDHFRLADGVLLCRFVEAAILAEQAAAELRAGAVVKGRASPWLTVQEKAVRALLALSMRLRLSPQSRIDPQTAARAKVNTGPFPWEDRDRRNGKADYGDEA